ncbi:hypothetical protein K488DRAFT_75657 [Vararia minispora EC-137]|uniref:Uncharacterized protein n=1 Tax=Vararia minispora EC-137 TaxID=1314806 RepID=A0ACB8QYI0_9AGAM|nr:hypothetical protein K488DRAFT_75657 [Vararia minispora EC-137]
MTVFVIPTAIQITTHTAKYTFASFLARDTVYNVIDNIRKLECSDVGPEQDVFISDPVTPGGVGGTAPIPVHKVTQCACGREGKHYSEAAPDTVFPGISGKIYNLMFASGFMKDWMREDLKLEEIQISDWAPSSGEPKSLARNMYVKPLNGSIRPKQTKCEIRDETVYSDFDDCVVTITTIRTPDVPSGNVFAVKTRARIMWASTVEWTGRSLTKGVIERSYTDGQTMQYVDLDKAVRTESATRGMQWAYDTFADAWVVTKRSTTRAIELSTSMTIPWFVIVFLVASNLWTLACMGPREEVGRRKELRTLIERDRWVHSVVNALWDELQVVASE